MVTCNYNSLKICLAHILKHMLMSFAYVNVRQKCVVHEAISQTQSVLFLFYDSFILTEY